MKKGEKMSEEMKEKIRKPQIGRTFTDEHREKIKKAHLGKRGAQHSQETKDKIRKSHIGLKHGDAAKKKISEFNISHPQKHFKDTSIELKIEEELKRRGLVLDRDYFKQVPLCKVKIVDFYLPGYRIVIEADGCYWHNCPIHGNGNIKGCNEKDPRQTAILTFNGFNVYRFWEHEINSNVVECINKLNIQ
jgi:DNA mismatch endonuclease (patch repair protein)